VKANVFVKGVICFQHALSEIHCVHSGAAVLLHSYWCSKKTSLSNVSKGWHMQGTDWVSLV